MKVEEFFLTVYFWGLTIPSLIFTFLICLCIYPFVDEKTFARSYESLMGFTLLKAMTLPGFWKINIVDLRQDKTWRNPDCSERRFVVIANHLSYIDSLISVLIPLSKKYLMGRIFSQVPVFGFLTRNAGYVTAERGNIELNKTAVDRAVATINKDSSSFQVYVEGMREKTPYIFEEFKTGAYRIAKSTNLEILPVTLKGTYEAMHGIVVGRAEITVYIDDPFPILDENYPFYIQRSKTIFSKNLKNLKNLKTE
jgi:1-acyl-sn-glycerol-3-phosphate acyltransferase